MARPRVIKLGNGGTIKLQDVSKEDAAKIEKALATSSEEAPEEVAPAAPVADASLREPALGITRHEGSYYVAVMRFNNEMTQVIIADKKKVEGDLQAAIDMFKTTAIDLGIV